MDLPGLVGVDRELSLRELVALANKGFGGGNDDTNEAVAAFAHDRVQYVLEQRGYPIEVVRGALSGAGDVPLRALRIAAALHAMRGADDFQALAVLFKRVKNIARELKAVAPLDRPALTEPAEQSLLAELDARRPRIEAAARAADYRQALTDIAALRPAVDRFFTDVFVMAEDARLRTARLTLMADLRNLILGLADISEIVPQTE
jgi:glycyl-tRNA synthetase beta chain